MAKSISMTSGPFNTAGALTGLISLTDLSPGSCAVIRSLTARGPMRRRLQDLGFIPGNRVACIRQSPLGDPSAYRICDSLIALRKRDSGTIRVEVLQSCTSDCGGRL